MSTSIEFLSDQELIVRKLNILIHIEKIDNELKKRQIYYLFKESSDKFIYPINEYYLENLSIFTNKKDEIISSETESQIFSTEIINEPQKVIKKIKIKKT
jgi:hypothetical protein